MDSAVVPPRDTPALPHLPVGLLSVTGEDDQRASLTGGEAGNAAHRLQPAKVLHRNSRGGSIEERPAPVDRRRQDQKLRLSLTEESNVSSELSDSVGDGGGGGRRGVSFSDSAMEREPTWAPGVTLQAFRGQSLEADLARGVVTPEEVPPPWPMVRPDGVHFEVSGGQGRKRRCAQCKLLQHTRIQLRKNFTLAQRHPGQTTMQLLVHAMFVIFLYWLQSMGKTRLMAAELHPPIVGLGKIPKCVEFNGRPCTTLMYSPPGHPEVEFIMRQLAETQGLGWGTDVVPAPAAGTNWSAYFLANPNSTLAVVSFLDREEAGPDWARACAGRDPTALTSGGASASASASSGGCSLPDIVRYRVYWNETTRYSRTHRTYTPFYPMDFTREVQRSVDGGILTLRGRQAGLTRCTPRTVAVGSLAVTPASGSDPAKTFRVTHPGAVVQNPQLRCTNDRGGCAYGSRANERRRPPAGAVSTAHLDPTGLGPHDWYLSSRNLSMAGDLDGAVEFTVGRYDSADPLRRGWSTALTIEYDVCHDDWAAELNISTKSFPVVGDEKVEALLSEAVFLGFGVLFFYCGAVFNYFLLLLNMVREKQHKLRTAMLMMGLSRGSLWLSWLLYSLLISAFSSFLCICAGFLCGFQYFYSSNPFVIFTLFWFFALAMTSFSFFASSLISTERTAVVVGFLLFVVGSFFQVIVGAGTIYFYDPEISPIYRRVFYHYPPFNFAKVFIDIGMEIGTQDFEGVLEGDRLYYSWSNLGEGDFPTGSNLWYLLMNFVEYGLLAWYLDLLVTSDAGRPQPWYFPFLPSFWCKRRKQRSPKGAAAGFHGGGSGAGAGGRLEMNPVQSGSLGNGGPLAGQSVALRVDGLDKTFRVGQCCGRASSSDVHALKDCSFEIKNGRVFCLLGPNGAGKTTLLSILTGAHPPSTGDAYVCGLSIEHNMDEIRKAIGVCPQHDILWPELTAREHLAMFADIKGFHPTEIAVQIPRLLRQMKLHNDADIPCRKFSGGMKRRLSIGISTIGDPKVIFLDEPTTGTDPGNRQRIWGLIQEIKGPDRCIVLTTHSMDECEVLSDQVGIMLQGSLFRKPAAAPAATALALSSGGGGQPPPPPPDWPGIGNTLALKTKFGVGYRLMIEPNPGMESELVPLIRRLMPTGGAEAVMIDDRPGTVRTFLVPSSRSAEIPGLLRYLEDEQKNGGAAVTVAKQWSVQHATLEEAFMSIVRAERAQSSVSTGDVVATRKTHGPGSQEEELPPGAERIGFIGIDEAHGNGTAAAAASGLIDFDGGEMTATMGGGLSGGAGAVGGGKAQVLALVKKNWAWQKRQKCVVCCQIMVPAFLLVVVVLIQMIVDSSFAAKADWRFKIHSPKEVDVENLIPAMLRELELDTSEPFLNANRQYCYSAEAGSAIDIYCPRGGVISNIEFASFGKPTGSCGSLTIDPGCHVANTTRLIASQCVGTEHCTMVPSASLFGWGDSQGTPSGCKRKRERGDSQQLSDPLRLDVQIKCGRLLNDTTTLLSDALGDQDGTLRSAIDFVFENSEAGEELQDAIGVGVQDLELVLLDSFDGLSGAGGLRFGRDDFGEFSVADVLRNEFSIDTTAAIGVALTDRLRESNSTTGVSVDLADLLGRSDLRFTVRQLINATQLGGGDGAAPAATATTATVLGITPAQVLQLELAGINPSAPARLAFDTAGLDATQVALLTSMGLTTPLNALEDVPIDLGNILGLGGPDNTILELSADQLVELLDDANVTVGDLLGFVNDSALVDFALDVVPGGGRPAFVLEVNTDTTRNTINITDEVYSVLPVLFGGRGGGLDGSDLLTQLDEGLESPEAVERLVEDSVESVIVNYYRMTNTPPLTPPVMMWSTPRLFHVQPGGILRDTDGWLQQIDREVRESKKKMFSFLNAMKYNSRMQMSEFLPLATEYFGELPFASLIFSENNSIANGSFSYTLQVETEQVYMSWWLPVQLFYGVDPRSVLLNFVDSSIGWSLDGRTRIDVELQAMDYEYNKVRQPAISEALSYILFPFALTFLLPVFMSVIVYEKEEKIRELMKMSGMKMSYYWAVNYCYNYALYLLVVTVFTAVALLVEIRLWTQTSPTVLFVLLFLWGHALVSLAFLLSTFLSKHLTSNLAGYLIVVGGVLASLVFNGTVYYREQPPFIYMMYAPLAFYRAVYIMTDSCRRYKCVELEDVHAEMLSAYAFLVLDTVIYWVAFLYLDRVLPSKFGVPEHPLFFLKPLARCCVARYNNSGGGGGGGGKEEGGLDMLEDVGGVSGDTTFTEFGTSSAGAVESEAELEVGATSTGLRQRRGARGASGSDFDGSRELQLRPRRREENADSAAERAVVERAAENGWVGAGADELAVVAVGLRHVYDQGVLRPKTSGREALAELHLTIKRGECLALLGHNGAGKTTLISILTGLFRPTAGTARIFGLDVRRDMPAIHKLIGICPQFSILWDTLTCKEHLLFFARLKGLPADLQAGFVETTLQKVGLGLAADRLARNLSGGMKRRLSIAMALVGNPQFLVMDEPTTGLDPETRLELWRTLLALKQDGNKAILLATHAMDEAELLGDQICILSAGELKCKGTSLQLKQRYCPDMLLRTNFAPGSGKRSVLAAIPQARLQPGSEFEGAAVFSLRLPLPGQPPDAAAGQVRLSEVFETMERLTKGSAAPVLDWGVTQMDLESVFLKLCPASEDDLAPRRRRGRGGGRNNNTSKSAASSRPAR